MREAIRSKPKKRKSKVPVFLATVAALMIINIAILAILGFRSAQSEHYETTDPGKYRNFSGHIEKEEEDLFSKLYVFPDEIAEGVSFSGLCFHL